MLIDEKGEIIAGHGRVMAAEVLKMDPFVIVLSGLMMIGKGVPPGR